MNWESKEIIKSSNLCPHQSIKAFNALQSQKLDFCIQEKIPRNHYFRYVKNNAENEDFNKRISLYAEFASEIKPDEFRAMTYCQMIAITDNQIGKSLFPEIVNELKDLKVIRSTSPLDGKSFWIEIFNPKVSKANGSKFIASIHQIDNENIMALGNDYNDIDLLRWAYYPCILDNAPVEMKQEFHLIHSAKNKGLSLAVESWFGSLPNLTVDSRSRL